MLTTETVLLKQGQELLATGHIYITTEPLAEGVLHWIFLHLTLKFLKITREGVYF